MSRSACRSRSGCCETTDRAFQLVVSEGWLAERCCARKMIARVAATAMKFERVRQFAFRTISQIGISYPDSALSQTLRGLPKGAPAAGDRFPWLRIKLRADGPAEDSTASSTTRASICSSSDRPSQAAGEFGDYVRVLAIPQIADNDQEFARANVSQPSFYLLRPDGHVGLCGPGFDAAAIKQYLSARVHLVPDAGPAQAA